MANHEPRERRLIRNSTAEFLIFTAQGGGQSIEVCYEDETIWLTQKLMAELFDVTVPTINEHLKNIFASGELVEAAVIRKFRITESSFNSSLAKICFKCSLIVGNETSNNSAIRFCVSQISLSSYRTSML